MRPALLRLGNQVAVSNLSLPLLSGLACAVLGANVLLGWAVGNENLTRISPAFVSMKINTALCFIAIGMALARQSQTSTADRVARAASFFVVFLAGVELIEFATGVRFGIDQLFATDSDATRGLMSPATAACFSAAGSALLMTPEEDVRAFNVRAALWLLVMVTAIVALIGYAIDVHHLYRIGTYFTMAVHTAAGFVVLAAGGLALSLREAGFNATAQIQGSGLRRYVLAVMLVLTATWIHHVANETIGVKFTYLLFFPALTLAAIWGGLQAGLLATAVSAIIADVAFIEPVGHLALNLADLAGLIIFVASGFGISLMAGKLHLLYAETEQARLLLESTVAERTAELRRSEAEYRSLFEGSGVGKAEVTLDTGRFLRVNPSFCKLVGYSADELLDKTFLDITHPDDREVNWAAIQQFLLEKHGTFDIEKRYIRKDGRVIWVHLSSTLIPDDADSAGRLLGTAYDITERKLTDAERHESEARLRLAYQGGQLGAFEVNFETGTNSWTPELEAMYGLAPGTFGKTYEAWQHLVHPEDRPTAIAKVDEALDTGEPVTGEWRVQWRDGTVRWINGRFQAIKNARGEAIRLIGVNLDITDRKLIETELADAVRSTEIAQEAAGAMLYEYDPETGSVVLSKAFKSLTGYELDEIPSSGSAWSALIHPSERDAVSEKISRGIESGEGFFAEYQLLHKDGHWIWVNDRARFFREGGRARVLGMVTDITARMEIEAAIRKSDEQKAFLLHLMDVMRPIFDPIEIEGTACRLVGEHLNTEHAYYVEIDERTDFATVKQDYVRGGAGSLVAQYPLSAFRWAAPLYKSWLRKSGQCDKWNFCLTAGNMSPLNRRDHEQTSTAEPHIGLQG